ncbi:peptide-methionine (S)-S-oxide reductase MsrA [Algoriphagus sp. CAU 1675]|nr:peptide-methionine (S)-S-oxide reductase MsrA [Algoriphagus sp. CAU 1675]
MSAEFDLPQTPVVVPEGQDVITLGGGCFWCTEAVFQRLNGVVRVISGYSGGFVENPTYEEICSGTTGHAEVVQIFFDPKIIRLEAILEVFWATHDPTTLNRQGADVGPQYRSVVFYHHPEQKQIVTHQRDQIEEAKVFESPLVTEITAFSNFYPAEKYHQDYFNQHGGQPYCQFVILPKVEKLKKFFAARLKNEA